MGTPRFTPEFKEEAVRQITERGYSVAEVSDRLGVSAHSLYKWLRAIKPDNNEQHARDLLEAKSEILKLRANNLAPSMSRRGNCQDNAVAESFFSSLKKERIRKRIYKTRDLARADIFDYIEVFYNRARRYSHLGGVSPEAFEQASS
ncbi:transposase [Enterobacter cloacae]|uniref:transposase n=1 Tax=Enterobacter cloacae TaxID=550 RepID=UPI0012530E18|nr:transposase [Enterobacter cloacae]ELE9705218.1 transposase [Enterobacter cloacae]ELK7438502.1 transposase [Enterobacter cloacae]MBG0522396.1 transposase [Enterobacter cloacae]MCU6219501.1 transposase [Enterobacter cloacae]VAM42330.1 ISEch10 OrfB [Enterobacter cloacae]